MQIKVNGAPYECAASTLSTLIEHLDLNLSQIAIERNREGEIVDKIQQSVKTYKGLIINAGAYSHTSVAILDALKLLPFPIIEVHLSNIFQREEFRHESYVSQVAQGVICGLGSQGYLFALQAVAERVNTK